jgi:hypothetical protein
LALMSAPYSMRSPMSSVLNSVDAVYLDLPSVLISALFSSSVSNSHGSLAESTVTLKAGSRTTSRTSLRWNCCARPGPGRRSSGCTRRGSSRLQALASQVAHFRPPKSWAATGDAVDGSNGAVYAELSGCTGVPCMHMYNSIYPFVI